MNRSNEETLADVMLGEAVLKLLHDGGSINCGSLIEKLSEMASLQKNSARKSACQRAIEDIRTSFSSSPRTDQTAANDAFTASQLFAVRGPTDDNKKH